MKRAGKRSRIEVPPSKAIQAMFAKQVISVLASVGRKDRIVKQLLNYSLAWGDVPDEPVVLDEAEMERRAFNARFKTPIVKTEKKRTIRFADEVEPAYVYDEVATTTPAPVAQPVAVHVVEPVAAPVEQPFEVVKPKRTLHMRQMPLAANPNRIHTVIARNLPRDITPNEMYQGFSAFGAILDVYLPKNMDQNSPYFGTLKGFALIKYTKPLESAQAVAAGPLQYKANTITIEFAKADR
jgi:hypothetical protein